MMILKKSKPQDLRTRKPLLRRPSVRSSRGREPSLPRRTSTRPRPRRTRTSSKRLRTKLPRRLKRRLQSPRRNDSSYLKFNIFKIRNLNNELIRI